MTTPVKASFVASTQTSAPEKDGIWHDPSPWFLISGPSLARFLQSCSHPTSGNGDETDQYLGDISTLAHSRFRITTQDLIQFLRHDASGNKTPAEQNGMPLYSASWMIPVVEVHRFLHPYVGPANELPLCDNGHEIPAKSLSQFLQTYENPKPSSFDSGHETSAVQQLEDGGSESDPMSLSVTQTQSQDSDDELDIDSEATASISYGCFICNRTFSRWQERNRHVESYLPHSILCPFPDCTWTGRRQWDFQEHWRKKHSEAGPVPGEDANEIYDPRDFVELIRDGTPVEEVARYAFAKVQEGLRRLGKPEAEASVLGRNRDLREWIHNPSTQLS